MMKARISIGAIALFVIGLFSGLPFREAAEETLAVEGAPLEAGSERKTQLPSALPEGSALRRTLGKLATDDSAELGRLFDSEIERVIRDGRDSNAMFSLVASRWAEVDPQGMFDHLMAGGPYDRISAGYYRLPALDIIKTLFDKWGRSDPEAAIAAAFLAREHAQRPSSLGAIQVLRTLAKTDPERARSIFSEHPDIVSSASSHMSGDERRQHLNLFKELPASRDRSEMTSSLVRMWVASPEDAQAALTWLENQSPEIRASTFGAFLSGRATPPPTAKNLDRLRALVTENPKFAKQFMEKFGAHWAKEDLAGALAWSDANLYGHSRHEAMSKLLEGGAKTNLDEVIASFGEFRPGKIRATTAELIAAGLVDRDPVAALEWVQSLEDKSQTQQKAVGGWANAWAVKDIAAAGDYARDMPDGKAAERLLGEVAWHYSNSEPEEGFAWIAGLSPERATEATNLMVKVFSWSDWPAIDKSIAAMDAGNIRDDALRALGKATEITHGEDEALEWMRGLNEADRETAIGGLRWRGEQHVENFRKKL